MTKYGTTRGQLAQAQAVDTWKTEQLEWACPEQLEAFSYGPAPLLLSGGYGSGKTMIASMKLLALGQMFPRSRWAIFRRKHTDLMATTFPTFLKLCPPQAYNYGGRRADNEKSLVLNNGTEFLLLHMDDPNREKVIGGLELNGFLGDQAEETEEEIFDKLEGRVMRWDQAIVPLEIMDNYYRAYGHPWPWINPGSGRPIPPPFEILTCNPDVEAHWLYRRFHPDSEEHDMPLGEDGDKPSYKAQGYKMIVMDSINNKFLPKQNIAKMMAKDASYIRRYVKGQWGIPEGQIHDISALSLVEGNLDIIAWIRQHCHVFGRALDHGETAPTCCLWFAADRSGNIFFFQEYYMPDKFISEHRANIYALSTDTITRLIDRYAYNVADPQIFYQTSQKQGGKWSTAQEYLDSIHFPKSNSIAWTPADNNEMGTRNLINELLRVDPNHLNPFTGARGAPRCYFVTATLEWPTGCRMVLSETKNQRRERIGTLHGKPMFADDREPSVADHAYDAFRYACAARPNYSVQVAREKDPRSFASVRARIKEFKRRGGFSLLAKKARDSGPWDRGNNG